MLEYLQKDPVSHIDRLEPLRRGTAEILYDGEDGVMILETRSQIYMISMEQEEKCFQILKHYPPAVYAVHQKKYCICAAGAVSFSRISSMLSISLSI